MRQLPRRSAPHRSANKSALKTRLRHARQQNAAARAGVIGHGVPFGKRTRGSRKDQQLPFFPPEDWHEPKGEEGYRILVQEPGPGFRHVLTPDEVRGRLSEVPEQFLDWLDVVQFSRMTRKKQSYPCYGMQWGATIYLYPIEASLVEYHMGPPKPNRANEVRMYGGRWVHDRGRIWKLVWTEQAIKDFYLNNILIHELGHVIDERNSSYVERERFAEWFAMQYGYPFSQAYGRMRQLPVRRRHHQPAGRAG